MPAVYRNEREESYEQTGAHGTQNRPLRFAHIYYKDDKLASITAAGEYLAESFGKLGTKGHKFVKKYMGKIAKGIKLWWG